MRMNVDFINEDGLVESHNLYVQTAPSLHFRIAMDNKHYLLQKNEKGEYLLVKPPGREIKTA